MFQMMLGGKGSTPVLINLLIMCLKTKWWITLQESWLEAQGRAQGAI